MIELPDSEQRTPTSEPSPSAHGASGALARWDLDALFVLAGALVVTTTAWAVTRPGLRAFTDSLIRSIPDQEEMEP